MPGVVKSYEKYLQEIPTKYLEQCFLIAGQRHTNNFAISAGEVASVWLENAEMWIHAEQTPEQTTDEPCQTCYGVGFVIIERKALNDPHGARPCPDCNAKRLASW